MLVKNAVCANGEACNTLNLRLLLASSTPLVTDARHKAATTAAASSTIAGALPITGSGSTSNHIAQFRTLKIVTSAFKEPKFTKTENC